MSEDPTCLRVLLDPPRPAAWNMAIDEALLEDRGSCWLRFYSWSPPAISLGYFQDFSPFARFEDRFPIVRRLTGGGALLHARELTLSLALPQHRLPGSAREPYRLVNRILSGILSHLVEGLHPRETGEGGNRAWCFEAPTGLDLVQSDGRKVFGSAGRRRRGRLLHHGSLVLERHPLTPFTGALRQSPSDLVRLLLPRFAEELDLPLRPEAELPEGLRRRAGSLAVEKYGDPAWNRRRPRQGLPSCLP